MSIGPYQASADQWKAMQVLAEKKGYKSFNKFINDVLEDELERRKRDSIAIKNNKNLNTKKSIKEWLEKNSRRETFGEALSEEALNSVNPSYIDVKNENPEQNNSKQKDLSKKKRKGVGANLAGQFVWRSANNIRSDLLNNFSFFNHRYQLADADMVLKSAKSYLESKLPDFVIFVDKNDCPTESDLKFTIKNPKDENEDDDFGIPEQVLKSKDQIENKNSRKKTEDIVFEDLNPKGESITKLRTENLFLGKGSAISLRDSGYAKVYKAIKENKHTSVRFEILNMINDNISINKDLLDLASRKINQNKVLEFIKNNVVTNYPIIGRLKSQGAINEDGFKMIMNEIDKNISQDLNIADESSLISNVIAKEKDIETTNTEIFKIAYGKVKNEDGNEDLTDEDTMVKIYEEIKKEQDRISELARKEIQENTPPELKEEILSAQKYEKLMTPIANLKDLKKLAGTVGQQIDEASRIKPHDTGSVTIMKEMVSIIVSLNKKDDEPLTDQDASDIAEEMNRNRRSYGMKSIRAAGTWNKEAVSTWFNDINNLNENGSWIDTLNKLEGKEKLYKTCEMMGTLPDINNLNDAMKNAEEIFKGSVSEGENDNIYSLDPATKTRLFRDSSVFPKKGDVNSLSSTLTKKRRETGNIVEPSCLSSKAKILAVGAQGQEIADKEAGLENGINSVINFNVEAVEVNENFPIFKTKEEKKFKHLNEYSFEEFKSMELNAESIRTYFTPKDVLLANQDIQRSICETLSKPKKFQDSPVEMQNVIKELSIKLGLVDNLKADSIIVMYTPDEIRDMPQNYQISIYSKFSTKVFEKISPNKAAEFSALFKEIMKKLNLRPKIKIDKLNPEQIMANYTADEIRSMNEKIQQIVANKFDQNSLNNAPMEFQTLINEIKSRGKTPSKELQELDFPIQGVDGETTKMPIKQLPAPITQKQLPQNAQQDQNALASTKDQKVVLATLNNLIKIARDLDKEGKFVESEEVHKTIKKYMQ